MVRAATLQGGPGPTASTLRVLSGNFRHFFYKPKVSVFAHVAVSTEGHKVPEGVVALLASLDPVVDLQILQRAALPAPPAVPGSKEGCVAFGT